jgi:uncharacterized protein YgiM (DUF1202 family)
MPNHATASSRRVTRRDVVVGTAILAVVAAVLVSGFAARSSVSAAGSETSAAPTSGATSNDVGTPAAAEQIALLETSAAPVQPTAEEQATAPVSAPAEQAPVEQAPVEQAPAEQAAAPAVAQSAAPAAPSAESLITGRTMYATEPVNVRTAPGTDGTSVVVALNARDQVTAGDSVDGWVPVQTGDFYGWVKSGYLADGTAPEPAPVAAAAVAAPAEQAPAAESAGNWMEALVPQVDPNGAAKWEFRRNGGWGASDGHTNYIDPNVPASKRYSVMVHEYSHVLQVQVYGSLSKSAAAMSAITGASATDVASNEKTADCMALLQGASWVNYGCPDSLRAAASAVLAGHRA